MINTYLDTLPPLSLNLAAALTYACMHDLLQDDVALCTRLQT